jgi:hypothetical protein
MTVVASEISQGEHYRTSQGQVRRVESVTDTQVVYSARGSDYRGAFGSRVTVSRDKFAADVLEKCSPHWDPNFSSTK